MKRELKMLRQRLQELSRKRVLQNPKNYIDDRRLQLDYLSTRLEAAAARKVTFSRERFVRLAASLDAMSPLKVLGRGYAIARKEDGAVVKAASDVRKGDRIRVRLQKDEINANGGVKAQPIIMLYITRRTLKPPL